MTSDKESIARLVEICRRQGIKDVVFSPGSRNAPLVISFVESGAFNTYCIPDERTAAFFALGVSINTRQATIICCTSGSAALNYAPAISEAYYQGVPMLVLTADRPAQWIDQGIGQSIRQNEIYRNYIKASHTLIQEADGEVLLSQNDTIVYKAIAQSTTGFPGPVHINIPLEEPLYGTTEASPEPNDPPVEAELDTGDTIDLDEITGIWKACRRKLVLYGLAHHDSELEKRLQELHDSGQIVLLTETGANCYVKGAVQTIDRFITGFEKAADNYRPDLLVSLGGPVVSKKIKSLFLNHPPSHHWHVGLDEAKDTYRVLSQHIRMNGREMLQCLEGQHSINDSSFQKRWLERNSLLVERHNSYLKGAAWSDLKAFDIILGHLPDKAILHMGNSTVVRYVQLFDQKAGVRYFGNRGVSGIDGCSSTALGYAYKSDKLNVLITGDIAFHYDINAFWHRHLPSNFKLIIVNNQGGGIFRIIPGPSSTDQLTDYFEAHQQSNAAKLMEHYGLSYRSASTADELEKAMHSGFFESSDGIQVLEVFTPRTENENVLNDYFRQIHKF